MIHYSTTKKRYEEFGLANITWDSCHTYQFRKRITNVGTEEDILQSLVSYTYFRQAHNIMDTSAWVATQAGHTRRGTNSDHSTANSLYSSDN